MDAEGLEHRLRAAVRQGANLEELGEAVSRALTPAVAHDALMMTGRTPTEGLPAFGMIHRYDAELFHSVQRLGHLLCPAYRCETPPHDQAAATVVTPAAAVVTPAATVVTPAAPVVIPAATSSSTAEPDHLIRNLFSKHGIGSELRMPLRDKRGTWGTLSLLRSHGGHAFDPDELHRAERLAPALTSVLREYVTAGPLIPTTPPAPAGVVIVRADHTIRALTPQTRAWMEQMPPHRRPAQRIHEANLLALATQARGHARDPRLSPALVFAPAASYGRWLVSHAQPLGDGSDDIVITVQPATGRLLLPAFSRWYGLTAREHQVLGHLGTEAATKHIARRLQLSAHTVNDHLKAIYRKTGATSRDELTAALTS